MQLIDFNTYMVFENADIQTMIMLFQRNQNIDNYNFDYRIITQKCEKVYKNIFAESERMLTNDVN